MPHIAREGSRGYTASMLANTDGNTSLVPTMRSLSDIASARLRVGEYIYSSTGSIQAPIYQQQFLANRL